jgi:hypothetical protein
LKLKKNLIMINNTVAVVADGFAAARDATRDTI